MLIEIKLPAHKTVVTANKSEFLDGLCAALKQWRPVAPQIVKAAVNKRKELARDILTTAIRCLGDCDAIAQAVAAVIAADPIHASEYTELALQLSPNCASAIEHLTGQGEGNFANPPANINPPPGSVGSGAGQNTCLVCHNGHEMQIPCDQVSKFLSQHPGDHAGPCQVTAVTNP
jgi:hypothetical protein